MPPKTRDLLPPIYFNHLYLVLDDKTYRAIQASDFLRSAFPGKELRTTTTASGEIWSGTYYYCQENYLEFFGESTGKHWYAEAKEGWAGLAFSSDKPGGVNAVRRRIKEVFGYDPFYELRMLNIGGHVVNWFHSVRLAEKVGADSFDSWVMEYHPDIFKLKGIDAPASDDLSRRAYLSPWNSGSAPSPAKDEKRLPSLFTKITGVTVNMNLDQATKYAAVLTALGYEQSQSSTEIQLSGYGLHLTLRHQPEYSVLHGYRISSLRLQMSRASVAPITFVFAPGSRIILNEDLTADWFFGE